MLGIGEKFPRFSLVANLSAEERQAFRTIPDRDYAAHWKVYFFWPKDFTPLSLEEIVDFGALESEFRERHTQLLGCSVESELAHHAWRTQEEDLKRTPLADAIRPPASVVRGVGHRRRRRRYLRRPIRRFIVDPLRNDPLRLRNHDLNVSRDPGEVLRVPG